MILYVLVFLLSTVGCADKVIAPSVDASPSWCGAEPSNGLLGRWGSEFFKGGHALRSVLEIKPVEDCVFSYRYEVYQTHDDEPDLFTYVIEGIFITMEGNEVGELQIFFVANKRTFQASLTLEGAWVSNHDVIIHNRSVAKLWDENLNLWQINFGRI